MRLSAATAAKGAGAGAAAMSDIAQSMRKGRAPRRRPQRHGSFVLPR